VINRIIIPCITSVPTSSLRTGDPVEIKEMAPEDSRSSDMVVITRWQNRNVAVPLSQLKPIGVDESTTQAIEDWQYWIAQWDCF
jgi:hypothetical protein